MSPAPLLVLTPTLGTSKFLPEVVRCVARLADAVPLRHVLVAPAARVAELQGRWPGLCVLAEPPAGGMYAALNAAAASVPGWQWLTWINDDDVLADGFAESWRVARSATDPGVIFGDVDYLDEAGAVLAFLPVCRRDADVAPLLAGGVAPFTQQGVLVRRATWEDLGGMAPGFRIAADFDFWVRAAAAGAGFRFVSAHVASFRVRRGQLSADVAAARQELAAVRARRDLSCGAWRRAVALCRFRTVNAPRILRRWYRTGRGRSASLFAR